MSTKVEYLGEVLGRRLGKRKKLLNTETSNIPLEGRQVSRQQDKPLALLCASPRKSSIDLCRSSPVPGSGVIDLVGPFLKESRQKSGYLPT